MKRKLPANIKGTPSITKFFKRSSEIKANISSSNVQKINLTSNRKTFLDHPAQKNKKNIEPRVEKPCQQQACCVKSSEVTSIPNGCEQDGNITTAVNDSLMDFEISKIQGKDLLASRSITEEIKRKDKTTKATPISGQKVELSQLLIDHKSDCGFETLLNQRISHEVKDLLTKSVKESIPKENQAISSVEEKEKLCDFSTINKAYPCLPVGSLSQETISCEDKELPTTQVKESTQEKVKKTSSLEEKTELTHLWTHNETCPTSGFLPKQNILYEVRDLLTILIKEIVVEENKAISSLGKKVKPFNFSVNNKALPGFQSTEESSLCDLKDLRTAPGKENVEAENKTVSTYEGNVGSSHFPTGDRDCSGVAFTKEISQGDATDFIAVLQTDEESVGENKIVSTSEENVDSSPSPKCIKACSGLEVRSNETTSCGLVKTVPCPEVPDCSSTKMDDVTEMEASDYEMVVAENHNKQKVYMDENKKEDEEKHVVQSDTTTESCEMASEERAHGDEDSDDELDDELLCPPDFLCDSRVKPDVKTPEKCSTSVAGSPLTPISPYVEQASHDHDKCRYSLAKLVLEKPKQEKKDQEMARLQSEIHEQIEKGRMARLRGDTGEESEDDHEAILPAHQKELEKFASKDKEFSEEIPGEDVFPDFKRPVEHENGCSQPFPTVDTTGLDAFTSSLFNRSDVEIRELLCGGWVVQRYLVHTCPPAAVQWLFHILCYHQDNHTIQASYNALWSMTNARSNKNNECCLTWVPSIQDIVGVFNNFGANVGSLLSNVCLDMDIVKEFPIPMFDQRSSNTEQRTPSNSGFPTINMTRVVQFVTLCVNNPHSYIVKDLEVLAMVLCCLSLDLRLEICHHDIKTCLEAVYSALEPRDWVQEATKLPSVISQTRTHHRNKLHLVQIQPYSCRGRDIRRLAALQIMASLIASNKISTVKVEDVLRTNVDANEDKEIADNIKLFEKLENLLDQVHVRDETNYCELYTVLELLDLAVGAESLLPQEKDVLERIITHLRKLHRDIKDPRAMFISRTKVKDLILRTVSKFVFMAQGKKGTQASISTYFEDAYSDLYIETLKETAESDSNTDLESEKSFGAHSEPCSPAAPSEDNEKPDESTDTTATIGDLT